ncbi:DNA ligase [Synechococcus sp. UW179A]|uniref:DNA ligase n=1 Tax=Synechococcus sp. UW179A TaxID=2575510 RepID=UPI001FCB541E|nr:DNA ligase [Synechococcus sp. UW179A]
MTTRSSALTGLMVLISATAAPVLSQQTTITIEQINTVVFPADGATAAKAICTGLANGALTRDQVGSALARLQRALSEVGEPESATRYVKAFNGASAGINGCNVQVTGPNEDNLWNY